MRTVIDKIVAQATITYRHQTGETESTFDLDAYTALLVKECADLFANDLRSMEDYTGKACRHMIIRHFDMLDSQVFD